jgi:multiple sugar transport system substrate-binding protein
MTLADRFVNTLLSMSRAAALTLVLVAGCSQPVGESRQATVVLKHSKLFGDPGAFEALLDRFERRTGIEVVAQTLPASSDQQHQFYAINLQAGSADFDVLATDVIWIAEFARAGWLRDLTDLLPYGEHHEFFPGPLAAASWNERVYAIPWFIDAGLLYYRRDLLARYGFAPPRTWEQLAHIAAVIAAREPGMRGFVWQGKQYEGLVCNALEYMWSNGGAVLDGARVVVDSAANRQALGFMAGLIGALGVTPGSVTTATEESSRLLFGQGKAVFLRNWPYAWALFERDGSAVQGRVGVSILPHFPGHASAATLGGWQLAVNAHSGRPRAAEQLVAFLTSAEVQRELALAYGFQPTRVALYDDAALLATHPFLAQLRTIFAAARPRPVSPQYVRISQVLQGELSAIVSGLKSPEAGLAAAQRQIEGILTRAQ